MDIRAGTLTAIYLFDVAEQIDVPALRRLLGGGAPSRLPSKSTAPAYLRYQVPPLVVEGDAIGIGLVDGFRARFKFFDYGVVPLALSRGVASRSGVPTSAHSVCRDHDGQALLWAHRWRTQLSRR